MTNRRPRRLRIAILVLAVLLLLAGGIATTLEGFFRAPHESEDFSLPPSEELVPDLPTASSTAEEEVILTIGDEDSVSNTDESTAGVEDSPMVAEDDNDSTEPESSDATSTSSTSTSTTSTTLPPRWPDGVEHPSSIFIFDGETKNMLVKGPIRQSTAPDDVEMLTGTPAPARCLERNENGHFVHSRDEEGNLCPGWLECPKPAGDREVNNPCPGFVDQEIDPLIFPSTPCQPGPSSLTSHNHYGGNYDGFSNLADDSADDGSQGVVADTDVGLEEGDIALAFGEGGVCIGQVIVLDEDAPGDIFPALEDGTDTPAQPAVRIMDKLIYAGLKGDGLAGSVLFSQLVQGDDSWSFLVASTCVNGCNDGSGRFEPDDEDFDLYGSTGRRFGAIATIEWIEFVPEAQAWDRILTLGVDPFGEVFNLPE